MLFLLCFYLWCLLQNSVNKVETLKRYKFSLAFENSNEEDYVTEKFFQSLVAGAVPVVVGAPNIQDFAPSRGSILHIRNVDDVESVASRMKYLAANPEAFNQSLRLIFNVMLDVAIDEPITTRFTIKSLFTLLVCTFPVSCGTSTSSATVVRPDLADNLAKGFSSLFSFSMNSSAKIIFFRWKFDGPSDSFKALVDMAAVHSSCRLCIHIATKIREKEEMSPAFKKRPCKCVNKGVTLYHLYVRERGKFDMESIFLRSDNLTLGALESAVLTRFKSQGYVPIWKNERPKILRGGDWKVYRIYPVGISQREALYTFRFNSDADLAKHINNNPCAKLEVIFV
ncbi:hypothetical protein Taro_026137 [Colocasia esculenta]|uniref:Fucosyltransferase n=1 Tax=Colocasia esculenta TaxID=4460 RepID=A0A843VC34_COLES|nr:hypothetical protein [Colocasia esculenta]